MDAVVLLGFRDSWRAELAGGDLSGEARNELEQRLGLYEAAFELAEQIRRLRDDDSDASFRLLRGEDDVQTALLLGQRLDGMLEGLKRARNESPATKGSASNVN